MAVKVVNKALMGTLDIKVWGDLSEKDYRVIQSDLDRVLSKTGNTLVKMLGDKFPNLVITQG